MSTIPPALPKWLVSQYPGNVVDPDWLNDCVAYLQAHFPESTTQQLIKRVESQLLLSDLATSTLPVPAQQNQNILFPTRRQATLLQITSVMDIANPALNLLDTLKQKRERRNVPEVELKDGEEAQSDVKYPSGTVRLVLSDGHVEYQAFEYEKIEGLGLEEMKLGMKIQIHSVNVRNKILLLKKATTVIKGCSVEELEEGAEVQLEALLRQRLRLPPIAQGQPRIPPTPSSSPPRNQRPRNSPPPPQEAQEEEYNFGGDDFDMEAEEEMREMERAAKRAKLLSAPVVRPPAKKAPRPILPRARNQGEFGGEEEEEYDMDAEEEMREAERVAKRNKLLRTPAGGGSGTANGRGKGAGTVDDPIVLD